MFDEKITTFKPGKKTIEKIEKQNKNISVEDYSFNIFRIMSGMGCLSYAK